MKRKVAYFSMEIGLKNEMHTYSGGLGILAGDTLKSAADLKLPLLGVSLVHRKGFLEQELKKGYQHEKDSTWDYKKHLKKINKTVTVKIEGREVKVKAWKYTLKSTGEVPIIFLDTHVEGNTEYDKSLTDKLYAGDQKHRLCQEVILGIAGVKMIKELGYDIDTYHMNEGHAALLTIELCENTTKKYPSETKESIKQKVKEMCVFTTHTPIPAGHDKFSSELAKEVFKEYSQEFLNYINTNHELNMTKLALNHSRYSNAVAMKHGEVSRKMFPDKEIDFITNGVHTYTWTNKHLAKVLDEELPQWRHSPSYLRNVLNVPLHKIKRAHNKAKEDLINYINKKYEKNFRTDIFTIGFARRATGYKRADLLFSDITRLKEIADKKGKIQIVYAGKAHPHDYQGKEIIQKIIQEASHINNENINFVYLQNYDMDIAKLMVSGVNIWLNTPLRPNEASGTSGMKASHNGVPNLSVLDGWWIEGCVEGVTGWAIGENYTEGDNQYHVDKESLYEKLELIIIPMYYKEYYKYIEIMRNSIALNASYFHTHRMIKEYVSKQYF